MVRCLPLWNSDKQNQRRPSVPLLGRWGCALRFVPNRDYFAMTPQTSSGSAF